DVDAHIAALQSMRPQVVNQDRHHGHGSQSLDIDAYSVGFSVPPLRRGESLLRLQGRHGVLIPDLPECPARHGDCLLTSLRGRARLSQQRTYELRLTARPATTVAAPTSARTSTERHTGPCRSEARAHRPSRIGILTPFSAATRSAMS